ARSRGQPRSGWRSRAMIWSSRSIGRAAGGPVIGTSLDPQIAALVPFLDRQLGVPVIARIIRPDLRLDPARLVAQQQMDAGGRRRERRVDCRGERVNEVRPVLVADP